MNRWLAPFVTAIALAVVLPASAAPALRKVAELDLPGPLGERFDYMRIDQAGKRLFVTHLGAGQIYVVSLADLKVTATIKGTPAVEDVAHVPELNRLYTTNWGENKIGVVDLATMQVIERIPTADKPDGIEYTAKFQKIYVSNERGRAESIIDVRTNKEIKAITFRSQTGMPRFDAVAGKLYVNLQELGTIAVIDGQTDMLEAEIPVPGCRVNHGMALDAVHRRAFIGCEGNNVLVVLDLDKRQVVAQFDIGRGNDFIEFDAGLGRIYIPAGGMMTVIQQDDPNRYRALEPFPIAVGVHTVAVDQETHRVYVTEQQENNRPVAKVVVYEAVQ
jgi:YVTN family beta-propeller protein